MNAFIVSICSRLFYKQNSPKYANNAKHEALMARCTPHPLQYRPR